MSPSSRSTAMHDRRQRALAAVQNLDGDAERRVRKPDRLQRLRAALADDAAAERALQLASKRVSPETISGCACIAARTRASAHVERRAAPDRASRGS